MFCNSSLPKSFARAFAEVPDETIWEFADREVTLVNEDAAEPGPYRSAKTPWVRRLQELIQHPFTYEWDWGSGSFVRIPVTEVTIEKSSQSGFSEGAMNGIRWKAKHRPCNTIYAIDSESEAKKVARRLLRSLQLLDANIFTGDADDIKSLEFLLRGMELNFYGSFAAGKFANKQAPLLIADEVEEHGQATGDTSTLRNLMSRKKTAANGLQINLSKPKKDTGPIHKAFLRGNQEEFFIKCPHCGELQPITFFNDEEREIPFGKKVIEIQDEQTGRVVFRSFELLPRGQTRKLKAGKIRFDHCKDELGQWDKLRVSRETYYECGGCQGRIEEWQKQGLVDSGFWLATAIGTPGVISQHIGDQYSSDVASSWGAIALDFLDALAGGPTELQGWYNHRLGLPFHDEISTTEQKDITGNIAGAVGDTCIPYRRGVVPFEPIALILGSDIGGNYAKWAMIAVAPNLEDVAVIDWGAELDPDAVAEIIIRETWKNPDAAKVYRISTGFQDAKYRKTDSYKACLAVRGRRMIPCAGLGGTAARVNKAWSYTQIPSYPQGFKQLTFNDRDAKDEFYVSRLKKKLRRVWFPVDVAQDPEFVEELCAEELIRVKGHVIWNPHPGANHYGDCVKLAITGLRYLTRKQRTQREPVAAEV
jgi:hypothetical protein